MISLLVKDCFHCHFFVECFLGLAACMCGVVASFVCILTVLYWVPTDLKRSGWAFSFLLPFFAIAVPQLSYVGLRVEKVVIDANPFG